MENKVFDDLYKIDCKGFIEKVSDGRKELSYLSWSSAWKMLMDRYPDASYEIEKFDGLPYVYDPKTGYMVYTKMTINGTTHEMWLPVMNNVNKAMLDHAYTYKVKKYEYGKHVGYEERTVEPATMFDINKTIMRCLTKNMAMFGLGLYIYAGEDIPRPEEDVEEKPKQKDPLPQTKKQQPKKQQAQSEGEWLQLIAKGKQLQNRLMQLGYNYRDDVEMEQESGVSHDIGTWNPADYDKIRRLLNLYTMKGMEIAQNTELGK